MTSRIRHEFSAGEIADLLDRLDARLRSADVAAAIFVVGGAAMAVGGARVGRLTEDVDAMSSDAIVIREARTLAIERGLPETWLNSRARMWMPPLPKGVLDPPAAPGLRVTYADDGFLLANKLVAQRTKDATDLVSLAQRLGLGSASPERLEEHIHAYYTDTAALGFIVDGDDVSREVALLAQDASIMLSKAGGTSLHPLCP